MFPRRIDDPDKNWKFGPSDVHERDYWKHCVKASEACLQATSIKDAPWYVIPADYKKTARLIISQIILDVFRELKMCYPKSNAKRRRELWSIRKQLTK